MLLSEAILLGSVATEQGFGPASIFPHGKMTCALGTALAAKGASFNSSVKGMSEVTAIWPWTATCIDVPPIIRNPVDPYSAPVFAIIWRLNDNARWTRQQIAAWVAEQEKALNIKDDTDEITVRLRSEAGKDAPVSMRHRGRQ